MVCRGRHHTFLCQQSTEYFLQLALLDDALFIRSGVLVNVSGQKTPCWGESLLSAVHVDRTQFSAQ